MKVLGSSQGASPCARRRVRAPAVPHRPRSSLSTSEPLALSSRHSRRWHRNRSKGSPPGLSKLLGKSNGPGRSPPDRPRPAVAAPRASRGAHRVRCPSYGEAARSYREAYRRRTCYRRGKEHVGLIRAGSCDRSRQLRARQEGTRAHRVVAPPGACCRRAGAAGGGRFSSLASSSSCTRLAAVVNRPRGPSGRRSVRARGRCGTCRSRRSSAMTFSRRALLSVGRCQTAASSPDGSTPRHRPPVEPLRKALRPSFPALCPPGKRLSPAGLLLRRNRIPRPL